MTTPVTDQSSAASPGAGGITVFSFFVIAGGEPQTPKRAAHSYLNELSDSEILECIIE